MSCAGLNDELRGDQKRRRGEERATTTPAADTTRVSGRDGAAACEVGCEAAPTTCPRKKVSSRIAWATLLHRA